MSPPNGVSAVTLDPGPPFSAGIPSVLFTFGYVRDTTTGRTHDLSPDGQRFVMVANEGAQQAGAAPAQQLILVQHWIEDLMRRVPVH